MSIIEINHLTKDFGHGRGIFDVSMKVEKGICYGYLGPNGAGKTTTIRHLMGFTKPQSGSATIYGKDTWKYATELKSSVGYLLGEIAFPNRLTGTQFLNMQMQMRHVKDDTYMNQLLARFELDPNMDIHKMSLGVRRKLAVVTAFLHDPEVLILDEPTSGLDPIMQQTFIEFILDEKKRGKTILLSSHIFHEVDAACDRISIIKDGKIVADFDADTLKNRNSKIYRVTFANRVSYDTFATMNYTFTSKNEPKLRARIVIEKQEICDLLSNINELDVVEFQEIPFTLEDYFMEFYRNDKVFEEVR